MIEITNLKKSYKDTEVLKGINLSIEKGSIFGIAGRSGAGKSTLLRCINGIETFDSGTLKVGYVSVGSLNNSEMRKFRKNIGMIFQNFSLLNRTTVYENIALPMRFWKYDEKTINSRVKELLELVDMPEKIQSKARELSGGQKQRVAIARALAMNPQILLCDEATSALDPKSTLSILSLLKEINAKLGITIIVVTHEMSVLRSICKHVSIIENGSIEALGTTDEIFTKRPQALINLIGTRQITLAEDERSIEFFYSQENDNDKIITKLARELNIDFSIVDSELDSMNEKSINSIIIKVESIHIENIKKYFDTKNILWREILSEDTKEDL
ncbi:MAG: methionine ABC transporter ATP-binding protein [Lachnospirales bacterium]